MFGRSRRIVICELLALAAAGGAGVSAQNNVPAKPRTGILLLAHGGSKEWNGNVQAIATEVDKDEPTEVALGMADRTTLQAGVDKLTARGVQEIVAVPLFVSSHSSVIEATRFLLGLRPDAPPELADFTMSMDHGAMPGHCDCGGANTANAADEKLKSTPVKNSVPIVMAPALDRHRILAEILADRAAAISRHPEKEMVILVAHGPTDDKENSLWLADLNAVGKLINEKGKYARIEVATVRDDAEEPVREQATQQFRALVSAADEQGLRALIVPVLLSYGGIENGIRKRLDGLDHVMSSSGLLPDPRVAEWVKVSGSTAQR